MSKKRVITAIGAICLAAAGGALLTSPSAPNRVATSESIQHQVDSLKPNCRAIAMRRLRHVLDDGNEPFITEATLARVLKPLKNGGADLCDEITGQSFVLGGS